MGCGQSQTKEGQGSKNNVKSHPIRKDTNRAAPPAKAQPMKERVSGDAAPSKYKGGGPSIAGGESTPCFDDGMLFRIVKDDLWAFYNDTADYEMHVEWAFGPDSAITSRDPQVTLASLPEDGWLEAKMVIYPGETKEFIAGTPNGYRSSLSAEPLSEEYLNSVNAEAEAKIKAEMEYVESLGLGTDEEQVLAACVYNQAYFVDPAWPPVHTSLSKPHDEVKIPRHAWRRPVDFLPPGCHTSLINKVEANDIDQGQLGSCYLLSAIAALAEIPSKVEDMFAHPVSEAEAQAERACGAYRVTINKGGWWRVVIVDDYLPCVGMRPCFAKNREDPGELWVSLIEKAYAKLSGSYAAVSGGDSLLALMDLTGYPISRFDEVWTVAAKDPRGQASAVLFQAIKRYDDEGFLIGVNTPGRDNKAYMGDSAGAGNSAEFEKKYADAGLGMGHAYTVIKAREFPDEGFRLLQIRNPWGDGVEWTGRWHDDDPLWEQYPHVAEACAFAKAADGTFWMDWEEVLQYFDGGGTCFTKLNWHDYRVAGAFKDSIPTTTLEVTVSRPTKAFICLSQADPRGLPDGHPDKDYAAMLMSVTKAKGQGHQHDVHLHSSENADYPTKDPTFRFCRDLAIEYTFEPQPGGEPQLVIPRVYSEGKNKAYVLGIVVEHAVDGASLKVKFKKLAPQTAVFRDFPTFTYDPATPDEETEYQYNPEVGCPITRRATHVEPEVVAASGNKVAPTEGPKDQGDADGDGLPDGYTWTWYEEAGMHWADELGMYFNKATHKYFEPTGNQWWDVSPATGDWIECEP